MRVHLALEQENIPQNMKSMHSPLTRHQRLANKLSWATCGIWPAPPPHKKGKLQKEERRGGDCANIFCTMTASFFLALQPNMNGAMYTYIIVTWLFFVKPTEACTVGFFLLYYLYDVICRPSEAQTTLHVWGGPGLRFEPGTGGLEAVILTTRTPLLFYPYSFR